MLLKSIRISIVLLCLVAIAIPIHVPAASAADEIATVTPTSSVDPFVSTEVNPNNLHTGETAIVSVKLNNVPGEGYKSAEFTCTYNGTLVEKSNIAVTDLFGADPVSAIHESQNGTFIIAIAGANSNRITTSGEVFTFSVKGLQAGQSQIQCTARVSKGDNLAIDVPSTGADLTVLGTDVSPTPILPATPIPGEPGNPTATSPAIESPTPVPAGSLSGQVLASKPVTVRLLDAQQMEVASTTANPDGTFTLTPPPGDYTFVATASGFLSYQSSVTINAGNPMVFPAWTLLAGDVDGNNVIDQFDALTIGMSYSTATPEAADLNNDGVIDFLDLEQLAENYRQTGPTTGAASSSIMGLLLTLKPTPVRSPTPRPTKIVVSPAATSSPIPGPNQTAIAPTSTLTSGPPRPGAPYANAPLCPTHDPTKWHGLWDAARGCHYDHEHGQNPFTPEVAAEFPGFDLRALLCGLEVGTCLPSGPTEHTHKHGGFKWNVQLQDPQGCAGFEDATIGVNGSAIQYHGFGNLSMELEASIHSVVALLRQCKTDNPNDYGYVFVSQHVSYGEVASPYQGDLMNYPYYSVPPYDPSFGPYLTIGCIGQKLPGQRGACRANLAQAQANNADANWTSKPTGPGPKPLTSSLVQLFWRERDTYQMFDWRDQTYPYTFLWLCSPDGSSYVQAGCRYNNSTTQVHEIQGTIPASWDNLAGFDTDPRPGRITAQGYVTHFGELNTACTTAGTDCEPIKLVQAFVGKYGSVLVFTPDKGTNIVPYLPERDIYFCGGVQCSETSPGAVPSGWIGAEN